MSGAGTSDWNNFRWPQLEAGRNASCDGKRRCHLCCIQQVLDRRSATVDLLGNDDGVAGLHPGLKNAAAPPARTPLMRHNRAIGTDDEDALLVCRADDSARLPQIPASIVTWGVADRGGVVHLAGHEDKI